MASPHPRQEGSSSQRPPSAPPSDELQQLVDRAVERRLQELGVATPKQSAGEVLADDASFVERLEHMRDALPFDIHGGAYLWHYEPLISGVKSNTELYNAHLLIDAKEGDFGFHMEPRFRDSKLRPFFESNIWLQEAYASWQTPYELGTLKAGKEYSRFGHFWDGTFFGNQPYFDGFKLDPEFGLSLENTRKLDQDWAVEYALQFFPNDSLTNGSLQDRDTISVPGARKRSMIIARLAPRYAFNDDVGLTIGASGQQYRADFSSPTRDDTVRRLAFESQLDAGPFTTFGEITWQRGFAVTDFPLPGLPSDDVRYYWAGVEYRWKDVAFRFAYSMADYRDSEVRETTWLPGITWTVNSHLSFLFEYDAWRRNQPGGDVSLDRSLNLILYVHF